jgi:polysaccharide export outer membrane protein
MRIINRFVAAALLAGFVGAASRTPGAYAETSPRRIKANDEMVYTIDAAPPAIPTGSTWRLRVADDGTVNLGARGSVHVAGLTCEDAKAAIDRHLGFAPAAKQEINNTKAAGEKRAEAASTETALSPYSTYAPKVLPSHGLDKPKAAPATVRQAAAQTTVPPASPSPYVLTPARYEGASAPRAVAAAPSPMMTLSKGRTAPAATTWKPTRATTRTGIMQASAQEEAPASQLPTPAPVAPAGQALGRGRVGMVEPPAFPPACGPDGRAVPRECASVSLPPYVIHPPDILLVESTRSLRDQQIRGQHLVRPDGTISLGIYGSAYVSGMTLEQAKNVISHEISKRVSDFDSRDLAVDVLAYNSKVYYVITDGGGYGEQVYRFPITGNETVLDALAQINGLPQVASKDHIWVARPCQATPCGQMILPVDWKGITKAGIADTNYQLFPGDRVYVQADKLISIDSKLAKFFSPIERVFGVTLLGATTYNQISGRGLQQFGGF